MTDWKLLNQASIGINWLKEINEAENAKKTLLEILTENKASLFIKDERVLNVGVLIMASYILFVYPQQAEFDQLDFSKVDISKFKITFQEKDNSDPKTFCRRLRNSIAHAKFIVMHKEQIIQFKDDNNGVNRIAFEIDTVSMGSFIDNFILEVNRQKS
jgi:hypothetical protein